ncbi:MAG TPA: class I SAM-dependent methyltransferase [Acidobacteriaceae bacterium]|nr:class I SAM-dependent methyltransferase [Acidobacteriaceae bacterium]
MIEAMRRALLTEFMTKAPYQPATNYWRAIEVEEVIRHGLPAGSGLDLGCGDGHLMSIILNHAGWRDIVGVDIDPQETALAKGRGIYKEVIDASGNELPFSDRRFDFVFSNSVLEHIPDIDGVLDEIARVLRPGGRFLFTVPAADFHKCLRGPRFGTRETYLREVDTRCFHLRYWAAMDWSQHLRTAGLNQIHEHEYLTSSQVRRWESIVRYTSAPLYKLSGKKKPIEIQRQMKIRTSRPHMPRIAASFAARLLDNGTANGCEDCGCLLIEAVKEA